MIDDNGDDTVTRSSSKEMQHAVSAQISSNLVLDEDEGQLGTPASIGHSVGKLVV